ncbi:MAG: hypothetical protein N2053_00340 [Chitinispirillaceae bacterium]|nr:hypothetical protein [Chitinispirillaceae bacterium]
MKKISILFFLLVCRISSFASSDFSGYIENTTAIYNNKELSFTDVASARIEYSLEYEKRGGIELYSILSAALQPLDPFFLMEDSSVTNRIIFNTLNTTLSSYLYSLDTASLTYKNINDLMVQLAGKSNTINIENFVRHLPYTSLYPKNSIVLDRALVKLYLKYVDLFIGRQTIGWGTGYAFNPTDVWNKKNPVDPNAPKVGINAVRAEIPIGNLSSLSMVASVGTNIKTSSGGLRLKSNLKSYDYSLSFMRVYTPDAFILGLPERVILGVDFSGEIKGVGIFGEAAAINPHFEGKRYTNIDSLYFQTDIGFYYTFKNGLYIIAEYYFNNLGAKDKKDYNLRHFLYLLNGDMSGMGRHYGFAGITKDFLRYWKIELFALGNLTDRSVMILPSVEYMHNENISIKIGASISVGDSYSTEFGGVYDCLMFSITGFF